MENERSTTITVVYPKDTEKLTHLVFQCGPQPHSVQIPYTGFPICSTSDNSSTAWNTGRASNGAHDIDEHGALDTLPVFMAAQSGKDLSLAKTDHPNPAGSATYDSESGCRVNG